MAARKPLVIGAGNQRTELQVGDALDGVNLYVEKAAAPTQSDYGRPVIPGDEWRNTTNGVLYKWSASGAWLYDNAASLSRYVPARLSNGTSSPIPLNADGSIPAKLSNGTAISIQTQA